MMKLTDEQNLELKKTKWNKVGTQGDECVWVVIYADEIKRDAWDSICKLTGHDVEDSSVKLLVIGEKP